MTKKRSFTLYGVEKRNALSWSLIGPSKRGTTPARAISVTELAFAPLSLTHVSKLTDTLTFWHFVLFGFMDSCV